MFPSRFFKKRSYFTMKSVFLILFVSLCFVSYAQQAAQGEIAAQSQSSANAPSPAIDTPTSNNGDVSLEDTSAIKPIFPVQEGGITKSLVDTAEVEQFAAIPYPDIKEADVVYRQRVWEELDSRQKVNLPFSPKRISEDPQTRRFMDVLFEGLRTRAIKAYDAGDEKFTRELSDLEIRDLVMGKPDTVEVVDASDPRGLRRIKKVQYNKPEINDIQKFRLIEDWIFDRINARLICRIIGIAPVLSLYNDAGVYLGDKPLFWIHYPSARDFLNGYRVVNWKNYKQSVTWQQLLELRYFSGYIIQTTLDNPLGLRLSEYIKDPRERLVEGEKIRNAIFDYEQSMWEY